MFSSLIGSLEEKKVKVIYQWLPEWAYVGSEKDNIKKSCVWWDKDKYCIEVVIMKTSFFDLKD